jgi:hypothetical protein
MVTISALGEYFHERTCQTHNVAFICFILLFIAARAIFTYLAAVTITGDRAANLDLCLAPMAFSSGFFFRVTATATRETSVFKVIYDRSVILTSKCRSLDDGATTTYFNILGLTRPARTGLELTTSQVLS